MNILDCIGNTPLVQLTSFDTPVPIFAKCEHLNPGGSVKDRLALALIEEAENQGFLEPGQTIVEATAGNTGLGLAMVAGLKGYRVVCVLPEKMSVDKRHALRLAGAEVRVTANAPLDSPLNFRNLAEELAKTEGWFLADQFRSLANVNAHYRHTGPEILAQLGRRVGAFVTGVGTGGTITGVGRYLKEQDPNTQIVLADPIGSSLAQWVASGEYGPDGSYAVEGIGSSKATDILDRSVLDSAYSISDEESFSVALKLQKREGLLVGGSAGTSVAAALRLAHSGQVQDPIVALLPDSWDRYFSQSWMGRTAVVD